jgi:hypothetical protein
MMRIRSFAVALGVLALSATRMAAQTCAGAAPFSAGPIRLGAGLATSEGMKSYGVSMAVGAKAGPFASGSLSRSEYSDIDGSGTSVGIGAGYAIDLNPVKTVQLCPHAGFVYQSGPDIDLGTSTITTSAHAVGFGGSIGNTVPLGPTVDFVPFAGASYLHSSATATFDGTSDTESQDYGEIDVGAGIVLNKTLTLQPSVAIPVGIDGAKSTFQLVFAFNFGSAKP